MMIFTALSTVLKAVRTSNKELVSGHVVWNCELLSVLESPLCTVEN